MFFPHGLDNTISSSIQNVSIHFCIKNQIVGDKIGVTYNQIQQFCCLLFILALIKKLLSVFLCFIIFIIYLQNFLLSDERIHYMYTSVQAVLMPKEF